ncbi:MAG: hypothetical protein ACFB2X_10315 [Rivularia sp. (in: cyanobacteria)]
MNPEIVIVNVNRDSVTIDKFGVNKGFEVMSINRVQRSRAADRKNIYQRLIELRKVTMNRGKEKVITGITARTTRAISSIN